MASYYRASHPNIIRIIDFIGIFLDFTEGNITNQKGKKENNKLKIKIKINSNPTKYKKKKKML